MYSCTAQDDPELTMHPKHHGIEICLDKQVFMIASYDEVFPVFITVESDPQIISDLDEAIHALYGELNVKKKVAVMALFCLMLFEALSFHESNIKLGASQ